MFIRRSELSTCTAGPEIENERGDQLIEDLTSNQLPNDHIFQTNLKPNTTFIVGRTRHLVNPTVFPDARRRIADEKQGLSTYIDIKNCLRV